MTLFTSSRDSSKPETASRAEPSASIVAVGIAASVGLSLIAYGPAAGAGFQRDDFRWLWHARFSGWSDLGRIFGETLGFYRPFTQLLWAFDLQRAGGDPVAFFVTNLGLHLLVLALFAIVARRLLRDPLAAVAATVLAALGHHYANMAVNWISGRGALLGAAASLAALWLWDRWCRGEGGFGAWLGACAAMAVGLGAYEGVAGVPLLMAVMIPYRAGATRSWRSALGPLALWVPYVGMRIVVGARQPWNEGEGYAYELTAMVPNLIEYAGRALLVDGVFVVLLVAVVAAAGKLESSLRAGWQAGRAICVRGMAWFVCGVLPALPVVSRSNLYIYFAALGLHLISGAALAAAARALGRAQPRAARAFVAAGLALVLFGWPLFAWDRNGRIADQGRLAMAVIDDLRAALPEPRAADCIVLIDDPDARPGLRDAFSGHLYWLGAYVFDEPPSDRIRYEGDRRDEPCPRVHALRLVADGERMGLRRQAAR